MSALPDDSRPTVPAIPLRARQKHKARSRKELTRGPGSFAPPPERIDSIEAAVSTIEPECEDPSADSPPDVPSEPDLATVLPRFRFGWIVAASFAASVLLCVVAFARDVRPISTSSSNPHMNMPSGVPASAEREVPEPPAEVSADDARLVLEPRKALIEREEARALLEKGLLERAIATARRAIEADPEDAMAWLILGAAEMESMHDADAAKTFRSCVQLAKRGPISECRAFVR